MFANVTHELTSSFRYGVLKTSRYLMLSAGLTALASTHLMSSKCYASGKPNAEETEAKIKAASRSLNRGFKQLPEHYQNQLIPTANSQHPPVVKPMHGRQFATHGKIENDFRKEISNLPEGTVVLWGDGYGRLSVDAFRRNGNIRVIYNDIDPQNMLPMKSFIEQCVKAGDRDQLVPIAGDCLTIPSDQGFTSLFPDGNPNGQVTTTFGANFLHFMVPKDVVEYFALQFDLLVPGGHTFSIAASMPRDYEAMNEFLRKECDEDTLQGWLSHSYEPALHSVRSAGLNEVSKILKQKGLIFTSQMRGSWIVENQGTTDPKDKTLLSRLYGKYESISFIDYDALKTIAETIGFRVTSKYIFTYTPDGIDETEQASGNYAGIVLEKPQDAPLPSDEAYFRHTDAFKGLEEKALFEVELAREVFRDIRFKPEYPFVFLNDAQQD
jgi:hypothetical protein